MPTKIVKWGSIAALIILAAVGALFNPVQPIMLPRNTFVMAELLSVVLFAVSLAALKWTPRLSIASIPIAPGQ